MTLPSLAAEPSPMHAPTPSFTTGDIAGAVQGELIGPMNIQIRGLAGIDQATAGDLTFIRSGRFASHWGKSKACAALITRSLTIPGHDATKRALIAVDDADLAMIKVLGLFHRAPHQPDVGIHPTAVVDAMARVSSSAHIGPHCIIGPHAEIGDHAVLHGRVSIGAAATIGPGTVLYPGVVVYDGCWVGAKCVLHANVVIGADGFGFRPDPSGRGLIKIPHIGIARIGNGVEIGACSCVDRGKFGATSIGDGTKIDNHVQIGHNTVLGRGCVICGMTGIGGSTTLGDGVVVAGHVGIVDGITMGDRSTATAKAGVIGDVPAGETFTGMPAMRHTDQLRAWAATRKLADHLREVKRISKLVDERLGD